MPYSANGCQEYLTRTCRGYSCRIAHELVMTSSIRHRTVACVAAQLECILEEAFEILVEWLSVRLVARSVLMLLFGVVAVGCWCYRKRVGAPLFGQHFTKVVLSQSISGQMSSTFDHKCLGHKASGTIALLRFGCVEVVGYADFHACQCVSAAIVLDCGEFYSVQAVVYRGWVHSGGLVVTPVAEPWYVADQKIAVSFLSRRSDVCVYIWCIHVDISISICLFFMYSYVHCIYKCTLKSTYINSYIYIYLLFMLIEPCTLKYVSWACAAHFSRWFTPNLEDGERALRWLLLLPAHDVGEALSFPSSREGD